MDSAHTNVIVSASRQSLPGCKIQVRLPGDAGSARAPCGMDRIAMFHVPGGFFSRAELPHDLIGQVAVLILLHRCAILIRNSSDDPLVLTRGCEAAVSILFRAS